MRLAEDELERLLEDVRAAADDQQAIDTLMSELPLTARAQVLLGLFNAEDYELMAAILPVDHVQDMTGVQLPGMGVFRGREEYNRFISDWVDAFPGAQLELEELVGIEQPEAIFLVVTQSIEGAASGVPLTFQYAGISEALSGKRHETKFLTDIEAARAEFKSRYGKLTR